LSYLGYKKPFTTVGEGVIGSANPTLFLWVVN